MDLDTFNSRTVVIKALFAVVLVNQLENVELPILLVPLFPVIPLLIFVAVHTHLMHLILPILSVVLFKFLIHPQALNEHRAKTSQQLQLHT